MLTGLKRVLKPMIKRAVAGASTYSGFYQVVTGAYGGLGVIFTLHRVVEPGRTILYPGYMIRADVLDSLLPKIRSLGWELVDLDEMARRLEQGAPGRRFACFTADDGYLDNLEIALPVFQRHQVPVAVYLCTGLLDRSVFYWWGGLEELLLTHDRIEVQLPSEAAPRELPARTVAEKTAAYDLIDGIAHETGSMDFLRDLFVRYGINTEAILDRDAMNHEQARRLARDPLVTIGAHGIEHTKLSSLDEAACEHEIAGGKRLLEERVGEEVHHLAYPFGGRGACGPREFAIAKAAGFRTAVTTRKGNIFPRHRDFLCCLPRRSMPWTSERLRAALTGAESLLQRRPRFQTD